VYKILLKPRSDWQVSGASFLRQKLVYVNGRIFLAQKSWRQKLTGIEHVLFQASFCRETPPRFAWTTDWKSDFSKAYLTLILRFYFTHTCCAWGKKAPINLFVSNCTLGFSAMPSSKKVIARTTDNQK